MTSMTVLFIISKCYISWNALRFNSLLQSTMVYLLPVCFLCFLDFVTLTLVSHSSKQLFLLTQILTQKKRKTNVSACDRTPQTCCWVWHQAKRQRLTQKALVCLTQYLSQIHKCVLALPDTPSLPAEITVCVCACTQGYKCAHYTPSLSLSLWVICTAFVKI